MSDDIRSEFSIDEQGKAFASRRAIARLAGVDEKAIRILLTKIANSDRSIGDATNSLIPYSLVCEILTYYYLRGKFTEKGCSLLGVPIPTAKGSVIENFKDGQKFKKHLAESKKPEKKVQRKIAKELKGVKEIPTEAGRIDILTSKEVIEVKQVNQWKSALGQVLVYGAYYPSHQKRIHLFGRCHSSYLNVIKKHCDKFNVSVTLDYDVDISDVNCEELNEN